MFCGTHNTYKIMPHNLFVKRSVSGYFATFHFFSQVQKVMIWDGWRKSENRHRKKCLHWFKMLLAVQKIKKYFLTKTICYVIKKKLHKSLFLKHFQNIFNKNKFNFYKKTFIKWYILLFDKKYVFFLSFKYPGTLFFFWFHLRQPPKITTFWSWTKNGMWDNLVCIMSVWRTNYYFFRKILSIVFTYFIGMLLFSYLV